jgi:Mn-containing catalase
VFGGGARLTDWMGAPWTAAYLDTIGQPIADLHSDIAAEARAKIVYEWLIKQCDDAGCKDTLTFLMTREVAHQKMFQAPLDSITENFPPGTLPGHKKLDHAYVADSGRFGEAHGAGIAEGFELADANSQWGFELDQKPVASASEQEFSNPPPPRPHHGQPPRTWLNWAWTEAAWRTEVIASGSCSLRPQPQRPGPS